LGNEQIRTAYNIVVFYKKGVLITILRKGRMIYMELNVFIGKVLNPIDGGWVQLPMSEEELIQKIDSFQFGEADYEIMDIDNDTVLEFSQYRDVFRLNRDLKLITEYEQQGQGLLLFTAIKYREDNIEDAIRLISDGNFEFYRNVSDTESLGQAIVNAGRLGFALMDVERPSAKVNQMKKANFLQLEMVSQYLDYESIGHDWECNGCRIYPELSTAIMETSPDW